MIMRIWKHIRIYWFYIVCSLIFAALSVASQLYVPILTGIAIGHMIGVGKVDFVGVAAIVRVIVAATAVTAISQWKFGICNNKITYNVSRDLRNAAIGKIQRLPVSYLDAHPTGDLVSRVIADVEQFADGLLMGFTQFFTGVLTILGTLGFMLYVNVPITLVVVCVTPLSFIVAGFIAKKTYRNFHMQTEVRGEQTAFINEMIEGQNVVQAFCHEKENVDQFDEMNERLQKASLKAIFFSSITNPATRFVNNVIYAGVALVGAFMIPGGALTVGGLSVLLSYANQYMKPFNDISSVITEMQNALACAGRIFALLEEKEESADPAGTIDTVTGNVTIDDVAFSYDKEKKLIENFNLDVQPGMRVAIVGPTGCGKTTFINLLMRFYDVDAGKICIDGKPIDELSRHALRSCFGMVLQDTWIKQGTVRDNISFGKPDATEEEIVNAAKEAHSWEFIKRLPKGFDTVLSEDSISQGQKQLLCITRVMLCLPPMLILDEATSSIDTRTELQVQEAFDKLMQGRTSFVVAHRLSTIRNASLILVMKDGKIIEQGRHEELLEKKGFYYNLYNSQFQAS